MISTFRAAYYAGCHAGMSGASYRDNPYRCHLPLRNIFLCVLWGNGWQAGITHSLNGWLKSRRVGA